MLRAVLVFLLLLPGQVAALSCLPWHVEDAFREAAASPDPYLVVRGKLEFATEDLPQVDWSRQEEVPPETRLDARLSGFTLGPRNASVPFDERIRLIVECSGPWCPGLQPGADYVAFVKVEETDHELRVGSCKRMAFEDPAGEMVERIRSCFEGGDCRPPVR